MDKNYKYILLTILTISMVIIAFVELSGISKNGLFKWYRGGNEGYFYSKDGEIYRGEIYPEQTRTRWEVVKRMPKTTIQFYENKFNFGTVSSGKLLSHVFRFKNTGVNPLMIGKTDVTCNCTVTYFTMESIAPGADGELTINYDSQGQTGFQQKNIIVHSNTMPETVSVGIEADVK